MLWVTYSPVEDISCALLSAAGAGSRLTLGAMSGRDVKISLQGPGSIPSNIKVQPLKEKQVKNLLSPRHHRPDVWRCRLTSQPIFSGALFCLEVTVVDAETSSVLLSLAYINRATCPGARLNRPKA